MAKVRKDIGTILLEKGKITQEQLQKARETEKETTVSLSQILVDLGYAKEQDVAAAEAEQLGFPFVDLSSYEIDRNAMSLFTQEMMERYNAIPIAREGNKLTVAMADPTDVYAIDEMQAKLGLEIVPVKSAASEIKEVITHTFGLKETVSDTLEAIKARTAERRETARDFLTTMGGMEEDLSVAPQAELELAEAAPIVRFCRILIAKAIEERATDIHIEPMRDHTRIRYRVDGVLYEPMSIPKHMHPAVISRVKILADLDIAERRLPQDGHIRVRDPKSGDEYDIRVATIPSIYGEKAVLRLLPVTTGLKTLDKLGMLPETQARLERIYKQPQGMLLSTGPTGHGKTTTQFAIMNELNTVDRNIITIEDPVEYRLPGINQVHVNRKAGLTFAMAMRHFVRQDPDIIMVGEIRDLETAEMAFQAALTGHLVLSTLHTNDAPSGVTRLVDMGAEPYLIADTVTGILAQRLGRRICTRCKEPYTVTAEDLRKFGFEPPDGDTYTVYRGRGCELCRQTGYFDRIGIFELMTVDDQIRELITRRASLVEIREAAKAGGMKTLKEDALEKILLGITTIEEALRVIFTAV